MAWEVYIIRTASGKLYTGITTDLDRRLSEHASGRGGAKFFRTASPQAVVYRESQPNRSAASRREHEIKRLSRADKLALIHRHARP